MHTHTRAFSLPHPPPRLSPALSSLIQDISKDEVETRENIAKWTKMGNAEKVSELKRLLDIRAAKLNPKP
jgi:hypothetical protein